MSGENVMRWDCERGLLLEWKPAPVALATGQRLMYERLSKTGLLTVLVIAGDAETMVATHMASYQMGVWYDWQEATLSTVKVGIKAWVQWAERGMAA